jgi:hypothetical protein
VRGIALTVLSATVRCLPHTNPVFFRPIAVSLVENLKYASELIKEASQVCMYACMYINVCICKYVYVRTSY